MRGGRKEGALRDFYLLVVKFKNSSSQLAINNVDSRDLLLEITVVVVVVVVVLVVFLLRGINI